MKNYKNIRQKPYIYGFTVVGFFTFAIGGIMGFLSLLGGFSFFKLVGIGIYTGVLFLVSKYVISNKELINKFFDKTLQNKYSEYE